jgi:RHS repeat-associated protein
VQTLDYYPHGAQRIASGSFSEQRRFIGEEYDPDTEFSYLNARYYQGSRAQFMSQDPVFLALGDPRKMREIARRELMAILIDPQTLNSYAYARNNPLILVDKTGQIAFVPLIFIGIQIYGAYQLGYHFGEVLNAELLFRGNYSPQARSNARFALAYDAVTGTAGLGLTNRVARAALTLSSDGLDTLEYLDKAGDEKKRKYDQSRSQANVTLTSSRSSNGGSGGSTYNYFAQPIGSTAGYRQGALVH